MTRTCRQSKPPCEKVPKNSAKHRGQDRERRNVRRLDQPRADRFCYRFTRERADQVETGCKKHGDPRRQNSRRYYGRNRVCGVMEAVDVIENQNDQDDEEKKQHSEVREFLSQDDRREDVDLESEQ